MCEADRIRRVWKAILIRIGSLLPSPNRDRRKRYHVATAGGLFTLLIDSGKTERRAEHFPVHLSVRSALFAFLRNLGKTERGAGPFLDRFAVRAALFAFSKELAQNGATARASSWTV